MTRMNVAAMTKISEKLPASPAAVAPDQRCGSVGASPNTSLDQHAAINVARQGLHRLIDQQLNAQESGGMLALSPLDAGPLSPRPDQPAKRLSDRLARNLLTQKLAISIGTESDLHATSPRQRWIKKVASNSEVDALYELRLAGNMTDTGASGDPAHQPLLRTRAEIELHLLCESSFHLAAAAPQAGDHSELLTLQELMPASDPAPAVSPAQSPAHLQTPSPIEQQKRPASISPAVPAAKRPASQPPASRTDAASTLLEARSAGPRKRFFPLDEEQDDEFDNVPDREPSAQPLAQPSAKSSAHLLSSTTTPNKADSKSASLPNSAAAIDSDAAPIFSTPPASPITNSSLERNSPSRPAQPVATDIGRGTAPATNTYLATELSTDIEDLQQQILSTRYEVKISAKDFNCAWRCAWAMILTQQEPEALEQKLFDLLGDQFRPQAAQVKQLCDHVRQHGLEMVMSSESEEAGRLTYQDQGPELENLLNHIAIAVLQKKGSSPAEAAHFFHPHTMAHVEDIQVLVSGLGASCAVLQYAEDDSSGSRSVSLRPKNDIDMSSLVPSDDGTITAAKFAAALDALPVAVISRDHFDLLIPPSLWRVERGV